MINKKYNNKNKGFTLIELSVTMGVAMILMSIAAPNMLGMLQRNKITALHNELVSSLSFARSTAITAGSWATFCHSNEAGTACSTPINSVWTNGWIVFADKDNDGVVDSDERVLSVKSGVSSGINITATKSRISYGSQGHAVGYAGKITFCSTSSNHKEGMVISANGRVRTADSNDTLADCPSV